MKSTRDKYIIYKYDNSKTIEKPDCIDDMHIERFSGKIALKADILFSIESFFRQRIMMVFDKKGQFVHYSYIIPKCRKFPFLKKGDIQIGPCYTESQFRGNGVYAYVLNSIAEKYCTSVSNDAYVLIREENVPSNKGINKAGFSACGEVYKTKYLKHYKDFKWYK